MHQFVNQFIRDDLSAGARQVAARRIHKRQNRSTDFPSLIEKLTRSGIFHNAVPILAVSEPKDRYIAARPMVDNDWIALAN